MVCWISSSRVLTATSGTCASIRLPSPTMAWSRVPVPYACPASPVFTSRRVRGWKRLDQVAFHSAQRRSFSIFTAQTSSRHLICWLRCTTSLHDTAHLHPGLTPIVGRSSAVLDCWSVAIVEPKIRSSGLLGFELFGTSMRHPNSKKTNTGRIW